MTNWWFKGGLFILMSAVIVAAFVNPPPMSIESALVAEEITNDPAGIYRMFYFHVPQALTATAAFIVAAFFAVSYLRNRQPESDIRCYRANQIGLLFGITTLITGMVFSRFTWGMWWSWAEPRMTSMFIVVLMFGGYFSLRSSIGDPEKRATLSSVMAVMFTIAGLFMMFVVPRIAVSRHPTDSIIDSSGGITMGPTVRWIFLGAVLSYLSIAWWMWRMSVRVSEAQKYKLELEFVDQNDVVAAPRVTEGKTVAGT